jgi:hypothetical protein
MTTQDPTNAALSEECRRRERTCNTRQTDVSACRTSLALAVSAHTHNL